MIANLVERGAALPPDARALYERFFRVERATGHAVPPPSMRAWIEQQFGTVDAVAEQTIVRVCNAYTGEETLFNPLRARRPAAATGDDAALERWIAAELAKPDMFSTPETHTTADAWGRIRGRFCVSAANVAKYEAMHGLIIFDQPHPLRWTNEQLRDYMDTALRWLLAAHAADPSAIYPIITWNCLPKSGATLMHGHMQLALARGRPYQQIARWHGAAVQYRATEQRSYFDDLWALYDALGLAVPVAAPVRAYASLTPHRNREVVLFAPAPDLRSAAPLGALTDGVFQVLRGLVHGQGMRAFNMAVVLPPLAATREPWSDVPLFARVLDRGDPLSHHSDLGAMELLASGCVVADPFVVAEHLQRFHLMAP